NAMSAFGCISSIQSMAEGSGYLPYETPVFKRRADFAMLSAALEGGKRRRRGRTPKTWRALGPARGTRKRLGVREPCLHLTRILMLASERESQRDSAIKPRVASRELHWETSGIAPPQPRRGCAGCSYD